MFKIIGIFTFILTVEDTLEEDLYGTVFLFLQISENSNHSEAYLHEIKVEYSDVF